MEGTVKVCTFWPWQGNVTAKTVHHMTIFFCKPLKYGASRVMSNWDNTVTCWETLLLTAWPLNGPTHQHNPGEFGYHRKLDDWFPGIRSQNGYPHWESTLTACRSNGSPHSDLTPVGTRLSLHWLVRKMYGGFPLWNVSFTGLFS